MPVIVVGADTPTGLAIVEALLGPGREVRAFVSDVGTAQSLKKAGAKVALGDVSDDSHIEGAATNAFSAILMTEAALDDRERAFAADPTRVLEAWARAVSAARVARVIWVASEDPPTAAVGEVAVVRPDSPDVVARVVALDEAQTIASDFDSR